MEIGYSINLDISVPRGGGWLFLENFHLMKHLRDLS